MTGLDCLQQDCIWETKIRWNHIIKPTRCTNFSNFIFGIKFYRFRTVPLSIIRNFPLYTQQTCMTYTRNFPLYTQQTCMTYTIAVCTVKIPDGEQRNCPKHVEFYSKNKIWEISASSLSYYTKLSRCTVTWTSNKIRWLHPSQWATKSLMKFAVE